MNDVDDMACTDTISFTCPRCNTDAGERFFGPCAKCRSELRSTVGGVAKEVDVGGYEPKLNVTPNAVALKDL